MARVKGAMNARKKKKKVLRLSRGYRGQRSNNYRIAKQAVMKSLSHSFAGRKQTKRNYRKLWISRINACARLNGLSYSKFVNGLKRAEIDINRKMLADLAITDQAAFASLVETAKEAL